MSFLRYDQTTADWVIFAPSRARRPDEFRQRRPAPEPDSESIRGCPFCPGNESRTPAEIYAERPASGSVSQWTVRVVPNKFPALRIEEDHRHYDDGEGFRHIGGCGAHEVIIESPDHSRLLAEQPVEQIEAVLRTAQLRYQDLMRDTRFQTVVIFKNH
jgi:UDPglucose--hexose-1-phosphate uridylyltransferase